jgi:hypothetical protein
MSLSLSHLELSSGPLLRYIYFRRGITVPAFNTRYSFFPPPPSSSFLHTLQTHTAQPYLSSHRPAQILRTLLYQTQLKTPLSSTSSIKVSEYRREHLPTYLTDIEPNNKNNNTKTTIPSDPDCLDVMM